jgi:hypothetical protein
MGANDKLIILASIFLNRRRDHGMTKVSPHRTNIISGLMQPEQSIKYPNQE